MIESRKKLWYALTIIFCSISTILLVIFVYKDYSILAFINASSIVSILFALIGIILFILQGGFLNGVIYGFRRVAKAAKKRQQIETDYNDNEDLWPHFAPFGATYPFIAIGSGLFLIDLLISLFFL